MVVIEWTAVGTNLAGDIVATFTPDPAEGSTWGVRRMDTLAEVVPSGTVFDTDGAGRFWYNVTEPTSGLRYEYWIKATDGSNTVYIRGFVDGTPSWNVDGTWGGCKKWYIDESGNFKRVRGAENNDYTDVSCNRIGNAAVRWIERQFKWPKNDLWQYVSLPANQTMIQLERALYVKAVYEQDNANPDSFGAYPRYQISWTAISSGLCPAQQDETALTLVDAGGLADAQNIVFGDSQFVVDTIYVAPSSEDRRIVVIGGYYSAELVNDSDVTYWTKNHPEILVRAMMREDELFRRNTTGVQDYEAALLSELYDIHRWFRHLELNATGRKIIG